MYMYLAETEFVYLGQKRFFFGGGGGGKIFVFLVFLLSLGGRLPCETVIIIICILLVTL